MNEEYNNRRKKQVLLVLLIVLILAFVTLLSSYGIRYIYKQPDSSQIITDSNISESPSHKTQIPNIPEPQPPPNSIQPQHSSQTTQVPNIPEPQQPPDLPQPLNSSQSTQVPNTPEPQHPPNPLQDSQLLAELENKIFVCTESLELTEKELQFLKQLLDLESSDSTLLENEKLRFLKEISGDLIDAYKAYKNVEDNFYAITPSPEDIQLFKSLSEKKVTCFQEFFEDIRDKFFPPRNIKYPSFMDSFHHKKHKAERPIRPEDSNLTLQKLEEKIISNYEKRKKESYEIDANLVESFPAKELLNFMSEMDDYPFIIFWYSFGWKRRLPTTASGHRFIDAITKKIGLGVTIYKKMIENYLLYLDGKLLDELLSTDPKMTKADKRQLVSDAMTLYCGKFNSIRRRIVKSPAEKFDDLKPNFSYYSQLVNFGIYRSLDLMFKGILESLFDGSIKEVPLYQSDLFYRLVKFLSNDAKECWGLPWLAEKDPKFILYFYIILRYKPNLERLEDLKDENLWYGLWDFLEELTNPEKKNLKFHVDDKTHVLTFASDFKSPFPQMMGDEELKSVITKITTKIIEFRSSHK
jgi:hypothetical protein